MLPRCLNPCSHPRIHALKTAVMLLEQFYLHFRQKPKGIEVHIVTKEGDNRYWRDTWQVQPHHI